MTASPTTPLGVTMGADIAKAWGWVWREGRFLLGLEARVLIVTALLGFVSGGSCVGCLWATCDVGPRVHVTIDRRK